MLQAYAREEFDDANIQAQQAILELIKNPSSTKFRIQLEFGIKIIPSHNSGIDLTIIYATNKFVKERANDVKRNTIIKRHDSVELGDKDYQQVLGILSVIELTNTSEASIGTLIIGAGYEVTIKNKQSKLMPYTEVKYKFKANGRSLDISIFDLDYVSRPLCVIPQRQHWALPNNVTYSNIKNLRMWCFDLAYVDRTSWEDYHHVYNILPEDDAHERGFDFLMTQEQLDNHSATRTRHNNNLRPEDELLS